MFGCGPLMELCDSLLGFSIVGSPEVFTPLFDGTTDALRAAPGVLGKLLGAGDEGEKAAEASAECRNSFTINTRVLLADGKTKPIQDIHVGDKISNAVPGSTKRETHTVTAVHVTHTDHHFDHIGVTDAHGHTSLIDVTSGHLIYDASNNAWTPAWKLKPGDRLQTPAGDTAVVTSVTAYTTTTTTYNLTIDGLHDYYVVAGDTPVLVHNVDQDRLCDLTLGPIKPSSGVAAARGDRVTPGEQQLVNEAGDRYGCSTCNRTSSGYSDGHWTGDHVPANKLAPLGPWTLFPHCKFCARQQGGIVNGLNQGWYDFPPEP